MRGEFNRGSSGRGSPSSRGTFNGAARGDTSFQMAAKIMRASDQVAAKVEKHHAANQEKWVNKRYGELLTKAGNSERPAPLGLNNDPKVAMMARAKTEVSAKRTQRLVRVEKAASDMLASGRVRQSVRVQFGVGDDADNSRPAIFGHRAADLAE